jgi:hypothetical protein
MQTNDTDFFAAALNEYRNQQDHLCLPFESLTPCEQSRIIQRAQSLKMEAQSEDLYLDGGRKARRSQKLIEDQEYRALAVKRNFTN